MALPEDVAHELAALRAEYAKKLPTKLEELESLLESLQQDHSTARLETFHQRLHALTGSGATYGYPRLSETARALERRVKAHLAQTNIDSAELSEWKQLLAVIAESTRDPQEAAPALPDVADATPSISIHNTQRIYVLDIHREDGEFLADQLRYFGYDAHAFAERTAFEAAIAQNEPDAVIMEVDTAQNAAVNVAGVVPHTIDGKAPIIFISEHDDLAARLRSVRAGGTGYFVKPINVDLLVDHLDRVLQRAEPEPFRVLIVEDSASLAHLYATTLEGVGMATRTVSEPMHVLEAIQDFNPELILMDMYMPDVQGDELAQVIRQEPAYVSIPIVFLSAEADVDRQLAAMRTGGDEFLTKPINLAHLIFAVIARVERYRVLRTFMQRDGLTGLLNHTKSKEFLQSEVSRAQREHHPLSFAMLDIDHFKLVNDRYGHPVGDRVIKGLSRLLQQRLRKSDLIGRYGGEEFAVVLPSTTLETAYAVLDELRKTFSNISFIAGDSHFTCTFSCGVVEARPNENAAELIRRADEALYNAKHSGRNRVIADALK